MKWILDRIGHLIAVRSQEPASGHDPITPSDPHKADEIDSSHRVEMNSDAKRKELGIHYWRSPPAQNAFVAKSAMKASANLAVSREVTASTRTTATETITTIVTEAWNSTDPDLTLM